MRYQTMFAMLAVAAFGCGGEEGGQEAGAQASQPQMQAAPPATGGAMEAPTGEIDAALASQGEALFASRGCQGCHNVTDQQLIGPGLRGVTERRTFEWITAMVTNPDSMLAHDPTAQGLFEEYNTPMVNMGATHDDVRAIYEYLRSQN